MFLTEEKYKETLELIYGNRVATSWLEELQTWAKETLQLEVCNYVCDYANSGLLRLKLVLWDKKAMLTMFKGMNLNVSKQKKIASKFAELARKYKIHKEYWNELDIFVCYETIYEEIQKKVLKIAENEIRGIKHPDIWNIGPFFEKIYVFYETDEQVVKNEEDGTSDNIRRICAQIVSKYDEYNVYADGIECIFDSHQTIEEKYQGNMYFYFT